MPYRFVCPETVINYKGVQVFHVYVGDDIEDITYECFTTNFYHEYGKGDEYLIRAKDLVEMTDDPSSFDPTHHEDLINALKKYIDSGKITNTYCPPYITT